MFAVRIVQPFAAAARLAGDEDRRRRRLAGARQRAAQPAAHRVDRIRADDRPRARHARRGARGRDHAQLPRRRRQDLAQRRLRDHGTEQLQPDPARGGERRREEPGRRGRRQRPHRRRGRVRQGSSQPPSTRPRARCSGSTGAQGISRRWRRSATTARSSTRATRRATTCRSGSPIVLTFANGEKQDVRRQGHLRPAERRLAVRPRDDLAAGLGRAQREPAQPLHLHPRPRRPERREPEAARPDAHRLPEREGADATAVRRQPDQRPQLGPEHPLRAARALRDRQPVRDRQHARPDGVRADARDRDAARDRHDAPPGAADDPARERDHGADRRRARDPARDRPRRAARRPRRLHPVLAAARLADHLRA